MAYSVSLWFDENAERQVRSVWQSLADAGVETTFANGLMRPHVTLAHGLEGDLEPFVAALRERLETQPTFDLTFTSLGLFDSGILYLAARMTQTLWTLHREVAALAEAQGGGSSLYYRPDFWTPHCTLALNLTPEATLEAVRVCYKVTPLSASVTRVGIIENPSAPTNKFCRIGSSKAFVWHE